MEQIGLWGTKPLKGTNGIHNGHNERLENCKQLWPVDDPENYRSMSLVSHIGKLFTSTINTRLMKWSEDNSVLTDAQFGFRPGYGTHDAISALHSIISKSLRQGKTQALISFKKYIPPPLPYFKVNICPLPLPHFASIFFAYLCSFHWPNYIVTLPRYFSFRLPHLNINTGPPSD